MSSNKINAEIIDSAGLLTAREAQVFRLVCEGNPDKTIAHKLAISIKTVENHLDHIYKKIGVQHRQLSTRAASIATAVARGLVLLTIKTACVVLMINMMHPDDSFCRLRESVARTGRRED